MAAKLRPEDAPARNGMQTAAITRRSAAPPSLRHAFRQNSCLWKSNLQPFIFPGGPSAPRRVPEERRCLPDSAFLLLPLPRYPSPQALPFSPTSKPKRSPLSRPLPRRRAPSPPFSRRSSRLGRLKARHISVCRESAPRVNESIKYKVRGSINK